MNAHQIGLGVLKRLRWPIRLYAIKFMRVKKINFRKISQFTGDCSIYYVCIHCTFLFIIPFQCVAVAPHNKYLRRLLSIAHQNTMWKGFVREITKIFAGRRLGEINDLNTYRLTGFLWLLLLVWLRVSTFQFEIEHKNLSKLCQQWL